MALSNKAKVRLSILGIFILVFVAALFTWGRTPAYFPLSSFWNKPFFHLGLDLKGGAHLVYQADTSQIDAADSRSAVDGVRDVIERRVNAFGVSEPIVQVNEVGGSYRVIVELAGVSDVKKAIEMIGATPLLEFKETVEAKGPTDEELTAIVKANEEIKKKAGDVLKEVTKAGADFSELAKKYSEDPGSKDKGGDLDWAKKGAFVPEFEDVIFNKLQTAGVYPELVETQFGYHIIKKIEERGEGDNKEVRAAHILLATKKINAPSQELELVNTNLSGKQLKRAQVQTNPNTGQYEVGLVFNEEGAKLFEEITARNVGKPVAILLDGAVISSPTVQEKITGGKAVITGKFNNQDVKDLVDRLNAGALPVPITLISQQTVGASLGNESVTKSIWAGIWGFAAIAIFMIIYYRLPGFISVLALAGYTVIVLTIFKLIPVTLTLAGIAGFILSLGMAVDANVLIFERLKEELRAGKDLFLAIEEGFKRAWPSIRDSNFTTLLICLILIWFGTSVVKGFAITLSVGILISMFSAIVITRNLLKVIVGRFLQNKRWIFGVSRKSIKQVN